MSDRVIDVPYPETGAMALTMTATSAESLVIVAFKDDRQAGELFREWLALPGTMTQFTEWATSPKRKADGK
jgi:hypothetical protein